MCNEINLTLYAIHGAKRFSSSIAVRRLIASRARRTRIARLTFGAGTRENRAMRLRRKFLPAGAAALGALALLCACGEAEPRERADAETRFPLRFDNGARAEVRLAITEIERTRGLMGCRGLADGEGMLFVYPVAETRAFWMKNVPVNLDIGFFDPAGRLLEVRAMAAHDLRTTYSDSDDVQYCLEMREGWFEANGVLPENESALNRDDLNAAVRARGFRP